jgi:hypothetical protein
MSSIVYASQPSTRNAWVREKTEAYGSSYGRSGRSIDREIVEGIRRVSRAEAGLIAGEAHLLAALKDSGGHEKLGFHFGDLVREVLRMDPRTGRNRVTLHHVLEAHPNLRRAFLEGRVSACQVLAVRSVLTNENESFWVGQCGQGTVRELAQRVRAARMGSVSLDEHENLDCSAAQPVSFAAGPIARLAWERGLRTARQVLGWEAPVYRCVDAILPEAAPDACPDEAPSGGAPGWRGHGEIAFGGDRKEESCVDPHGGRRLHS